jgi:hypothetical protein
MADKHYMILLGDVMPRTSYCKFILRHLLESIAQTFLSGTEEWVWHARQLHHMHQGV